MLGVLDEDGTAFTFTEKAGDESNSRIYSVHVKKKCDSYDKTDDYGEDVLRSWNDEEGTICFQAEWEGKVGDAVPTDEKVKKLVDRMSSMAAFTKVQIIDGQTLDGQSMRFVEKFLDTEQFKIEFPIDQAIIGSNVHKFINKAYTRKTIARIGIILLVEGISNYKSENVREFFLDLPPVNELLIAIKRDRNDTEYEQNTEIFDKDFFETLITKKNHNHVAVENALDGDDFFNTLMNRIMTTTRRDWTSVEFNVAYPLMKTFMEYISGPVEISDGQLKFSNSDLKTGSDKNYYNGYLYISEKQLHCFFLKQQIRETMAVYVGPEVHGDGRRLEEGVFTLRFERNIPEYWAWREYVKHRR